MSVDALDVREFLERVQDDRELLLELLDIFNEDFKEKRKAIDEAVNAKNLDHLKNVVHSLKGSSGNISAKAMHALCIKIEQMAKGGDISAIASDLQLLDQQFADVQAQTAKLKEEFKQ